MESMSHRDNTEESAVRITVTEETIVTGEEITAAGEAPEPYIDFASEEVRKIELAAAAQEEVLMEIGRAEEESDLEASEEAEEPASLEVPAEEAAALDESEQEPSEEADDRDQEPSEGTEEPLEEPASPEAPAEETIEESASPEVPEEEPAQPVDDDLVRVIGVRFRTAGKVYYFDPGQWDVRRGKHVIVETVRGIEFGTVVGMPMRVHASKVTQPLKEVIRIATPEDEETERNNRLKEKEAYRICQEKIIAHGLDMKLINAEYTFDNSKVLFYFTADGRVDFRDLVKNLASVFRTRIELRQIGVRDETKILGGYGICGRPLCCHTWMSDFIPVSIKMAKEQNLSLNPGKISGVCGRLMCCLKNEADTYEELNKNLPRIGDEVQGSDGLSGQVESVNVLRQTARILVEVDDEKEYHEYHVDDITILRRRRRGGNRRKENNNSDTKEAQELEKLENEERKMGRDRGDRQNRNDRDQNRGDRSGNDRNGNGGGDRNGNGGSERNGNGGNERNGNERNDRDQNRGDRGGNDRNGNGGGDRGERQGRGDRQNRGNRRNNRRRNNQGGAQNGNASHIGAQE